MEFTPKPFVVGVKVVTWLNTIEQLEIIGGLKNQRNQMDK